MENPPILLSNGNVIKKGISAELDELRVSLKWKGMD